MENEMPNVDIYDEDLIIRFEDEEDLDLSFDEDINLEVKYHNELQGLDYEEAGHTGFTPSRLSLLNNVGSDVTNQRLVVMANVDNVASKITANDLRKRMIRTESSIPNDLQVGQYLFLEKSNNQENVEGE